MTFLDFHELRCQQQNLQPARGLQFCMSALARTTTIRRRVWLLIPLASTLVAPDDRAFAHALEALPASLVSVARTVTAHAKLEKPLQIVAMCNIRGSAVYSASTMYCPPTASPMIAKENSCGPAGLIVDSTCNLQIAATLGVRG